jgi:flagellar basal body P-ring formation protein FlgA
MSYYISIPLTMLVIAGQANSAAFTPSHPIRARSVIASEDVVEIKSDVPGSVQYIDDLVGQEAKVTLFPGQVILLTDIIDRAQIERNAVVTLVYSSGVLSINTEGRALQRGVIGESIRVMNVESKVTVVGTVISDGIVEVRK